MLFKRQKTDWLLLALVAAGVLLYSSYRPRSRLRPEMPTDFVDVRDISPQDRAGEEKIARAYWDCLVDDIQWKYGYGRTLPGEVPVDFNVGMHGRDSAPEDAATRARYWRRAQRLWHVRSSWEEQYEWNLDWTTDWVQNGGDWLHERFKHLGGE